MVAYEYERPRAGLVPWSVTAAAWRCFEQGWRVPSPLEASRLGQWRPAVAPGDEPAAQRWARSRAGVLDDGQAEGQYRFLQTRPECLVAFEDAMMAPTMCVYGVRTVDGAQSWYVGLAGRKHVSVIVDEAPGARGSLDELYIGCTRATDMAVVLADLVTAQIGREARRPRRLLLPGKNWRTAAPAATASGLLGVIRYGPDRQPAARSARWTENGSSAVLSLPDGDRTVSRELCADEVATFFDDGLRQLGLSVD